MTLEKQRLDAALEFFSNWFQSERILLNGDRNSKLSYLANMLLGAEQIRKGTPPERIYQQYERYNLETMKKVITLLNKTHPKPPLPFPPTDDGLVGAWDPQKNSLHIDLSKQTKNPFASHKTNDGDTSSIGSWNLQDNPQESTLLAGTIDPFVEPSLFADKETPHPLRIISRKRGLDLDSEDVLSLSSSSKKKKVTENSRPVTGHKRFRDPDSEDVLSLSSSSKKKKVTENSSPVTGHKRFRALDSKSVLSLSSSSKKKKVTKNSSPVTTTTTTAEELSNKNSNLSLISLAVSKDRPDDNESDDSLTLSDLENDWG